MIGLTLQILILICLRFVEILCSLLTISSYWKTPKRCPPIDDRVLLYPACTLAEKIRNKETENVQPGWYKVHDANAYKNMALTLIAYVRTGYGTFTLAFVEMKSLESVGRRFGGELDKNSPHLQYPSLVQLKAIFADRQLITSETVVKAYISRIKAVNPILNAVVEDRFSLAIEEAKHADELISSTKLSAKELGSRYPLLGLPITVKESVAVAGLSHCSGRILPGGRKAAKDAEVIKLCKKAGAIPLLVSNTPELCMNFETFNNITGTTNNPYDTRRTPGGSSGGEAALLASGASIIGIGSDLCGSIRLPPHFCGIWGHKPSPNIINNDDHYPDCRHKEIWKQVLHLGPMCRYAIDLPLIFSAILEAKATSLLQLNEQVSVQNIKFYYMENDGGSILSHSIDKDIVLAIRKLVTHLTLKRACKVEKLQVSELKNSAEISFIRFFSIEDIDNLFDNYGTGAFTELVQFILGQSQSVFPPILYGILRFITSRYMPKTMVMECNETLFQLKHKLCEILGRDGVLLYPCHPTAASFHGHSNYKVGDYGYTAIFSCLGFPVTSCPLGLNSEGLPIGIQVISAPNNDRLTLTVAQEIEKVFGGWIPPPFSDTSESQWGIS